jgi:ubiquinone biosynthesis protein
MGPRALLRTLRRELPKWWEALPQMPALVHQVLTRAREDSLVLNWKSAELEQMREELRAHHRRLYTAIAATGLLAIGALLGSLPWWGVGTVPAPVPIVGSIGAGIGLLLLWWAWPKQ